MVFLYAYWYCITHCTTVDQGQAHSFSDSPDRVEECNCCCFEHTSCVVFY